MSESRSQAATPELRSGRTGETPAQTSDRRDVSPTGPLQNGETGETPARVSDRRDAYPTGLLHYRPWRGEFRSSAVSVWPIARVSLMSIFRKKMFWTIYVLGLLVFLLFFFGQYLLSWAQTQVGETDVQLGGWGRMNPRHLIELFRGILRLDGGPPTYHTFIDYQGYIVMIVLALAGSVLIGNDMRFGSLPFYLSKPLSRWHYLLGKGLAVAVFINLLTTIPAVILFVQWGVLESWDYLFERFDLLLGILGYGAVLTVTLTLLLLATATWLRRTVPLIMTWTTVFVFFRRLSVQLVDRMQFSPRWRLIDLWNSTSLVGGVCLNPDLNQLRLGYQPPWYEAALLLGGVSLLCLIYLIHRIRAVEIVR
jgi:ABC-type transport system involved in multi-copper enzyme maturation permease subunit